MFQQKDTKDLGNVFLDSKEDGELWNKEDNYDLYVSCLSCDSPCYWTGVSLIWIYEYQ